jgi:hypothetical protein
MSLSVGSVITDKVRVLLRDTDEGGILWLDSELIEWLNEACLEIARMRPASSASTLDFSPTAGALQTLPTQAILLLEAICNQTSGVEGRAVRRVERKDLDNEQPNWRSSTKTDMVMRYASSSTDPRTFHVYPPSTGSANAGLVLVMGVTPTVATALTDDFPLDDIFAPTAANYVLYRAFHKQLESQASQQRAGDFLAMFNAQMGSTDSTLENRGAEQRQPTPR